MSICLRHKQGQERRIKKGVPALTQGCVTQSRFALCQKQMCFLKNLTEHVLIFSVLVPYVSTHTCTNFEMVQGVNLISLYSKILIVFTI